MKVAVLDGKHTGPITCLQFNPKFMTFASACSNMVSSSQFDDMLTLLEKGISKFCATDGHYLGLLVTARPLSCLGCTLPGGQVHGAEHQILSRKQGHEDGAVNECASRSMSVQVAGHRWYFHSSEDWLALENVQCKTNQSKKGFKALGGCYCISTSFLPEQLWKRAVSTS